MPELAARLPAAERIVLDCLRSFCGSEATPPSEPGRLAGVAAAAQREGLAGVVARVLPGRGAWCAERQRLEENRLAVVATSGRFAAALRRLDRRLHAAGVRAIVLKGGALAASLYAGAPDLRPMSDLDLLVEPRTAPTVVAVLAALGYAERKGVWRGDGVEIDLHFDPLGHDRSARRHSPVHLPRPLVRRHRRPLTAAHRSLDRLDDELHLLLLAVHAVRHDLCRWVWLLDLELLGRSLQPSRLLGLAAATGAARTLAVALGATDVLLGRPVATRPELPSISRGERVWVSQALARPGRVHLGEAIAALAHRRWRDRIACWRELLSPTDEILELRVGRRPVARQRWLAATLVRAAAAGTRVVLARHPPGVAARSASRRS